MLITLRPKAYQDKKIYFQVNLITNQILYLNPNMKILLCFVK